MKISTTYYHNNKKFVSKFFISVAIFLFSFLNKPLLGATYYARANGEWNTTTTWSTISRTGGTAGTIPGAGDDVIIDAYDVTLSVANQACNSLIIKTSAYVATSFTVSNGRLFAVTTNVDMQQGNTQYISQALTITGTGTSMTVGGNFTTTISTTGTLGSKVLLQNTSTLTVIGDYIYSIVNKIEFNAINHLELQNSAVFTCANASVTISSGNDWIPYTIALSTSAIWNVTGNFTYSDVVGASGGAGIAIILTGAARLNVSGNSTFTANGVEATGDITPKISLSGTSQFNTTADFTCTTINSTAVGQILVGTVSTDASQFNVGGNFTWTNNAALNGIYGTPEQFYAQGASIFDVNGNFSYSNTDASNSIQGLIKLANTSTFNIGTTGTNSHFFDAVIWDGSGIQIQVPVGCTMSVAGDFRIKFSDNPPFVPSANQVSLLGTMNITGNLALQNTTTTCNFKFAVSPTASSGLLNVDGNIDMSNATAINRVLLTIGNTGKLELGGSFIRGISPNNFGKLTCSSTSTVEYNGTSNTQVLSGSGAETWAYQNLIINNTFGTSPQLTTDAIITVPAARTLTFTDGVVSASSTNYIAISSTAIVSGASNNSHVDGYVRKTGATAFTFPVGNNGFYAPLDISAPTTTTHAFTCRYQNVIPNTAGYDTASKLAPIVIVSRVEYWNLDRTVGTSNVTVKLSWDAARSGVASLPEMLVSRWNGTQWESKGNGGTTGTAASGTVISSAAVTAFSPFTLASTSDINPLPIELINFKAEWANSQHTLANINWKTASELNNDFFAVERSVDAINFEQIGIVQGAGNSSVILDYVFLDDKPLQNKTSYYRLKQTDFDGANSYSTIASLTISGDLDMTVYPNPASNEINFNSNNYEGELSVTITDVSGKLISIKTININKMELVSFSVTELAEGVYFLNVQTDSEFKQYKIVIVH